MRPSAGSPSSASPAERRRHRSSGWLTDCPGSSRARRVATMLRLALVLLLLMPAAAEAAPFGELPAQPVANPARCLRATGTPGDVVRWAPDGAEIVQATASGFGAPVHIDLGERFGECPTAVAQPSGAALVMKLRYDGIGVAVRDPGGTFAPPQTLAAADDSVQSPVAAISPRGDAVVAWTRNESEGERFAARVLVARRPAGGTFGAPVELQALRRYSLAPPHVALGIQDDGTVLALWSEGSDDAERERLFSAAAAPGAPFGPPQLVTSKLEFDAFSVTVAPDGRALAIVREPGHTRVLERPPGGTFARVADLGYTEMVLGRPAAALRPDGAAIVAWQDLADVQAYAIRRDGLGPFGRRERVGAKPPRPYRQELADFDGGAPAQDGGRGLQAAFAPDGRPVLTWAPAHQLGGLSWTAASVATFPGGVQALSGPLRDADSVTPVMLADGRPAVAWSDVSPGGEARVHLAIEGAPAAAEPPAPRVVIGRIEQIPHGLAVPFRCSAACDVRATAPDAISARHSLRAAGSGRLKIVPDDDDPIRLRRADSVPVQVVTGAAGARAFTRKTITARLRVPRLPRFLGVAAVHRGNQIVVSWHTDRPLRNASVIIVSSDERAPADPFLGSTVKGAGRRRFSMSVEPAVGDRYVQLYLLYTPDATERRIAVVRVTRH